ncbi:hypothetical protein B0H67DRAFT_158883 [Lasiosphaeris hirsuta]|uniref:Alpha and gamma adaptin binding protein p34 n=1 Tax=Lasiosphaeris hirsuta TaxID=260670 RepID=A0AA40APJ0_9PEZI|nr:hypothetical protein B0H67DRAFT_158883 [Lasiosphaeris hirsuta]
MEITNPRRILAVSLADSTEHLSNVIKDLTGTHPSPVPIPPASPSSESAAEPPSESTTATTTLAGTTLAGITHYIALTTPYYTTTIPIWLDLVTSPSEWATTFLAPEAKEVLDALGGILVVVGLPPAGTGTPGSVSGPTSGLGSGAGDGEGEGGHDAKGLISQMGRVLRAQLGGWEWDGVALVVGVGEAQDEELDEWEDVCAEWGMEFVHHGGGGEGRNEFGERMGVARALEALQANDWAGDGGEDEDEGMGMGEDGEFIPESMGFGFEPEDFEGLRKAILSEGTGEGLDGEDLMSFQRAERSKSEGKGGAREGEGEEDEELDDEEIQKLERMMLKLQAVRDISAGMPEEQRKRMAKQAVGEVMKEL